MEKKINDTYDRLDKLAESRIIEIKRNRKSYSSFSKINIFKHLAMYYHDKETLIKIVTMAPDTELLIKAYSNAILPMTLKKDPEFEPIIVDGSLKIIKDFDDEISYLNNIEREKVFDKVDQTNLESKINSYYDISEEDDIPFSSIQRSRQLLLRNYYNEIEKILTKPYEKLMFKSSFCYSSDNN